MFNYFLNKFLCLDSIWRDYNQVGTVRDLLILNCPNVVVHESLTELQCFEKLEENVKVNAVNFQPSTGKCILKKCSDLCSDGNTQEWNDGKWDAYVEPCGKYVN